jgi:hypothetical protein
MGPRQFGKRDASERGMGKLTIGVVVIVVLAAIGGAAFLAVWNPPVPSAPVHKVVPNARFER